MTSEQKNTQDAALAVDTVALATLLEAHRRDLMKSWETSSSPEARERIFQQQAAVKEFVRFVNLERQKAHNPKPMETRVP